MGIRVDGTAAQAMPVDTYDAVTVRQGDTLQSIANRFGVDVNDLMAANRLTDPKQVLMPGQELGLPTANYKKTPPAETDQLSDKQTAPTPLGGTVDAKSMAELMFKQGKDATLNDLIGKALDAGLSAKQATDMANKMRGLQSSEFSRGVDLVRDALTSVNPERAVETIQSLGSGEKPRAIEDYPIRPGSENTIMTQAKTITTYVGDSAQHSVQHNSSVNGAGLGNYLTKINGGGPLTEFEKKITAQWNTTSDDNPVLTPIYKTGAKGVQGYKLEAGGSGDRITSIYDRNGKVFSQTHQGGDAIGEDPIMDILLIESGRRLGGAGGAGEAGGAETAGKKVVTSVGEAESEAGASAAAGGGADAAFTETEKEAIKQLEQSGYARDYAEKLIREQRQIPRGGASEAPSWSGKPGPIGKKRYPY